MEKPLTFIKFMPLPKLLLATNNRPQMYNLYSTVSLSSSELSLSDNRGPRSSKTSSIKGIRHLVVTPWSSTVDLPWQKVCGNRLRYAIGVHYVHCTAATAFIVGILERNSFDHSYAACYHQIFSVSERIHRDTLGCVIWQGYINEGSYDK